MKINLKFAPIEKMLEQIAEQLGTKVGLDCNEGCVKIPKKKGSGCITGYSFEHGLGLMIVDCKVKEDMEFQIKNNRPEPLYFTFCIEGGFTHVFDDGHIQYQLQPLLGTISANPSKKLQNLKFPSVKRVLVAIMHVDRQAYNNKIDCELEKMPEELREVFEDVKAVTPFLYQSNYSIAIAECITNILNTDYEDLVRATYIESKLLELLSLQIKQFEDDLKMEGKQTLLREYEVQKIKQAKDILIDDLKKTITIPALARQVGLNQQKLKTGFKQIFNQTIRQYLRSEKSEKAKLLLLEGSMSISEIASHVGYSNKSHFSDAFRKKFGILPREFVKQIKKEASDK